MTCGACGSALDYVRRHPFLGVPSLRSLQETALSGAEGVGGDKANPILFSLPFKPRCVWFAVPALRKLREGRATHECVRRHTSSGCGLLFICRDEVFNHEGFVIGWCGVLGCARFEGAHGSGVEGADHLQQQAAELLGHSHLT